MALELFWFSGSPFAWRVMLALACKGLPYESRLLQRSKQENRTPEFLALNPRGQVPVLRDGDVVVYESLACLAYLDRAYPTPPLFGRTPAEAAAIWREVAQAVGYIDGPFEEVILPLYFGQEAARAAAVEANTPRVAEEIARLERTLTGRAWLVGDAPTAADCAVFPFVRSLQRALEKPGAARFAFPFAPLRERHPALAAWMARVEALPGYDATYPPHWR